MWLTPTVHKSKHHIKGSHRGLSAGKPGQREVRGQSQADGAAMSEQGRRRIIQMEEEEERWLELLLLPSNPPSPQLKLNRCSLKPNSPTVPDEK